MDNSTRQRADTTVWRRAAKVWEAVVYVSLDTTEPRTPTSSFGGTEIAQHRPRVLIVDDDPTILSAVARLLTSHFEVSVSLTGYGGLALAADHPPDLILLDVEIPDLDGYSVCESLKSNPQTESIPVVFLTSHSDEASEVRGLAAGASDFMAKPPRGGAVVARLDNLVRMKQLGDRLQVNAKTDYLTGLANRSEFDRVLDLEVRRSNRNGQPLSLLMIDVDYFKAYNDRYGHPSGDEVLRRVAKALRPFPARAADLVARYGGEEFVLVLPETDQFGAGCLSRSILQSVDALRIEHRGSLIGEFLTVSVGAATSYGKSSNSTSSETPSNSDFGRVTSNDLLLCADRALYAAKHHGRRQAWSLIIGESESSPISHPDPNGSEKSLDD